MSNVTQGLKGSVTVTGKTSVSISNPVIALANTEQSVALSSGLKELVVRSRNRAKLQLAFVATESGTTFFTVQPGNTLFLTGLEFSGQTLYIQSDVAGTTLEIIEFT